MKNARHQRGPAPYVSAADLPSVAEMLEQIRGMKLLTRVVARDQREGLLKIESQVRDIVRVVDGFYDLLGPRHWIFHESLNLEKVKELLKAPVDEAEQKLIALYQDSETLHFLIRSLRRFSEMDSRMALIEKAASDYEARRFYATALVLLTVMDGFVNDLDPASRRGLHTRDADELAAWDSIVGHHMGLTNAHNTFTTSTRKTSDEPLFELQRHGIIHGTLTNFDNVIVATKAWNRLFAVADWATSVEKQKTPPAPEPTWREILTKIAANERAKKALAAWHPRSVDAEEPGFQDEDVCQRTHAYLTAWASKNYGAMARYISPRVADETQSKTAGMIREACSLHALNGFKLKRASFEAAAACEIDVDLVLDSEPQFARMRWIRETADGSPATPDVEGEWFLFLWEPWAMIDRR
jgi:hypothetical protein